MSRLRRFILILFLPVLAGLAALGYGVMQGWGGGYGPWAFTLSWQQLDPYLETQVIGATKVALEVVPEQGRLVGDATLSVSAPGGNGGEVFFLLNPGLSIDSVTTGETTVRTDRYRERVRLTLPPDTRACDVRIQYSGRPVEANASTLVVERDEVLIDKLQFWYPVDLKNFASFTAKVTVPEELQVVWSGKLLQDEVVDGKRVVEWEEVRPILAAGLALGAYERRTRIQGSVRCNVYGKSINKDDSDRCLSAMGDAVNFLSASLGSDGFQQLSLVLSDQMEHTVHAGGPLLFGSAGVATDSDTYFVELASQVARNWWGDTVSGRWYSTRPEAGEWLVSGLAEYSAWQTLLSVKGRRSYLRYIELQSCPPRIDVPMKTCNLNQRLSPGEGYGQDLLRVRGAYIAATIAAYAGQDAFDRATKNLMSVHRYTTISFGALLHEITLASEVPLDELVRVWFDRPGTFDYRIADVVTEENRIHVSIENMGDIPSYVPIKLGIVTETGYHEHEVLPGGHSDTVTLPLEGTLQRVVLDPEFELGDMRRANNMWPPTEWPVKMAVASNGRIALLREEEWGAASKPQIAIFSRMDKAPEYSLDMGTVSPQWLQWDGEGRQLAVQSDALALWSQGAWSTLPPTDDVLLGWNESTLMMDKGDAIAVSDLDRGEAIPGSRRPFPAAIDKVSGDVVIAGDNGHLILQHGGEGRTALLRDGVHVAGSIGWIADERALMYFEREGDLVQFSVDDNTRTVVLHRNYQVLRSRISGQGALAAWVDPAGLMRAVSRETREPVYISLPGEIVDFAWEGEEALVALVAAIPRRLPMRYHAEYSLWRIPVSTWQGVQLPYDPVQFAQAPAQ